jgi:cysteine desulfurase
VIYLDNSATTPLSPEVLQAMQPYFAGEFGNASSVHTLGAHARVALEQARETIARSIHAEPKEIIFTSGGTESNNAAIKGIFFKHYKEHFGGKPWSDFEIVTSPTEHHAVLEPIEWTSKLGAKISFVRVDPIGRALPESVAQQLTPQTSLVSIMTVNNELGTINPIAEIAAIVREHSSAIIHSDAVQAFGRIPIDVKALDIDMLSLSAHKIHGPKGIGALYVRGGIEWEPLLHGGSQERNRRGGTEAVALAVGFAEAVKLSSGYSDHFRNLRTHLLKKLAAIPEAVLNSAADDCSVNSIVSFSFIPEVLSRLDADALIIRFDLEGIAVSNGSACTSGSQQPSHVLLAIGKSRDVATKSVRVSFSRYNTTDEIDQFVNALLRIIRP